MISRANSVILGLPRWAKRIVALCADIAVCLTTVAAAFALRLDGWIWPQGTQWFAYLGAVVFAIPLFVSFGLYRAIFRYAGWSALMSIARACAIYSLIYSFVFTAIGAVEVPRSIGVLQPILLFLTVSGTRAVTRYVLGGEYRDLLRIHERKRVLIYGAGSAGRQLAAALGNSDEMTLVGFVDDDESLKGGILNGKRIYSGKSLAETIHDLEVTDLLLAIPSATRQRRASIIDDLRGSPVAIRTLPGLMDLAQGRVTVQDLRELEIEDLLGREAVPPDEQLLSRNITGKIVLVSGAGGSIGSELCRQILALAPATLLLVEFSEFNLYTIEQELNRRNGDAAGRKVSEIIPILASVQDRPRLSAIFARWRPDTVYHAAAYKHVPIVEHNPTEGVRNNVFGTLCLAELSIEFEAKNFVLISTDKAVRPTNIMGSTKRLAELVLQAMAQQGHQTRFSMVRFGNVLGSSGSVVPLFRQQIASGGPITITHPEITRYFMTIPEAASLVIQAGAMASGGEVFVLDMGEPVKIVDLAKRMIELSGLRLRGTGSAEGDIDIKFVGLRPGEKLYEELLIGENPESTRHPRIMKASEHFIAWAQLSPKLELLRLAAAENSGEQIMSLLRELVPEARLSETNSPAGAHGTP